MAKLGEARERGLSCFGSETHGFALNAPIAEEELARFEAEHGVALPACYRAFLLAAGNGGAGPYYGIYALERWNDFATWVIDDVPADFLVRPCPLVPGRDAGELGRSEERDLLRYAGTISLGSQGCAFRMQLIVTGPYRGRVVYVDADGSPPYVVHEPDFLAWYERWLDELLGGYETGFFGYGPGGDEHALLAILDDAATGEEERIEAAYAIARLPALTERGEARIIELAADEEPRVRRAACFAIERFRVAADALTACLADADADVRTVALRAALALDRARFAPKVLEMTWADPDRGVAFLAVFALDRADALPREARLRIVTDSPHGTARSQAAYKLEWKHDDIDLLVRLLDDDDEQTRAAAASGLRGLRVRAAVPAMATRLANERGMLAATRLMEALGELGDVTVVPLLLERAATDDDFHQLDALGALAKIGDERAIPIARALLAEDRKPERRDESGFACHSHIYTIAKLARDALSESPNARLRELARK